MGDFAWKSSANDGMKERRAGCFQHSDPSNHSDPVEEGFGMAAKAVIEPDVLRQLLDYNPSTGDLFWKERGIEFFSPEKGPEKRMAHWNRTYAGKPALTASNATGHKCGSVLQKNVSAHRAAWAIFYGQWPSQHIDHINGNPSDNRIANLRDVSPSENSRNQGIRSDNKSGISGIWDNKPKKGGKRWAIAMGGRQKMIWRNHHCLGKAIKERNEIYRIRGFTVDHGIRKPFCS